MKRIFVHGELRDVEASDPELAQPVVDQEAELDAWRATTVVKRHHFAKACAQAAQFAWATAGVISWEDAKAWGPGNALPAGIDAALQAAQQNPAITAISTVDDLEAARVDALSSATIRRTHPIVDIIRQTLTLSEEQADDLFRLALTLEQTT